MMQIVGSQQQALKSGALHRTTITAGCLVRRQLRAALAVMKLPNQEFKGWLDSIFVIEGTEAEIGYLHRIVEANRNT